MQEQWSIHLYAKHRIIVYLSETSEGIAEAIEIVN